MATRITAAGESLIARLQAEGRALVIDKFIFAYVAGQNPTDPIASGATVPWEDLALEYEIPTEYRAFVNPNQVVYSALLGSDVGDFLFNWQGLFCTEHATLVAVSTFPPVEKRKTDTSAGVSGNNITRNFILEFTGAQAATGIEVDASTWQLDFSVRLAGIDERERLSNRDIYGRAGFLGEGWRLLQEGGEYRFKPGTGYVEGIRIALDTPLLLPAPQIPCSVWLDVAHEPSGSDIAAVVRPMSAAPTEALADYNTGAPFHTPHYLEKVAEIDAEGNVIDSRAACAVATKSDLAAHAALIVTPEHSGHLPAFGSAPQNAIVRRDPQNGGAPAWGADQIPVSIAGGFDFNTKTEPLYAYLNSTNLSEYSNHPPCFIGYSLALGFLQVQSYKDSGGFLRVIQRYTVWQNTGAYQGLQYTRALHGDPGIWSEWQHNGWQPDYSRAVTRSVPTQDSVFTMPYSGYVIARLAADVNAGRETYLYINRGGTNELVAHIYWNGNYTVENVFTVPVRQGDGVWAQGSGVKMFKTIPCLGEQA